MSITPDGIWAAAPTTTRAQPCPISADSKGERIAYASGKSIFVRSIDRPHESRQYTETTAQTTVARFSPSGFYIASGDVAGTVRVWDCVGEGATRGEYHIISGRINDIAWDGDSQRIIAVGDGKERFGHCVTADSGNSVGEISGHSKQINCVSIRQQRPLRAATGSDDSSMVFYHGAPFKFNTSVRGKHDKFVYGCGFSPDGAHLVTVGSDRKVWIYDGKTGEPVKEIGQGVHTGSIFAVSWSKDSKRFVTASADQTIRIWELESGKNTVTWRLGEEGKVSVPDQQVGVVWARDGLIISVDLEGNLNYLEEGKDKPIRIVQGHQKTITAAGYIPDSKTLWTGSFEGKICAWDLTNGAAEKADGETHSNYVSGLTGSPDGRIYSVGWDDTVRTLDTSARSFIGGTVKADAQPKAVAAASVGGKTTVLVATPAGVEIYVDGQKQGLQKLASPPTSIAAAGADVAVGCEDKAIRTFTLSGSSLSAVSELKDGTGVPSTLAFSSGSSPHLAAGLANGKILVYAKEGSAWKLVTNRWSAHTARVTGVSWSPDGKKAVSGGLDTNIFVWSLADPGKRVKAGNAHKDGVGGVVWVDERRVVSCGADAAVKCWKVQGVQ
ncbi:tricorn protease domain 2-containing protein [Myriangium duriaei CBS 260.36]|uniref:Tricorn protease domain 2-containing protein n=1 Tax=Myriangium duriaei CBS 260.36 TaxID=1168546 RepID=A0A9P4IYB5_9PEZI|nr:tricorn protease domain 2-containing protein [Myriangium duriaei CBS 260.36]